MTYEKERILAVDDNADSLFALQQILTLNGYEVTTTDSPEEAIKLASEIKPTLVLFDVMMPKVSGLELTQRIRANPSLKCTPIILLSACDKLDDVIKGLDHGADDYITKPYQTEELLARLRAALRIRRLYQDLQTSTENTTQIIKQISLGYTFSNIIGQSAAMKRVFALVKKVIDTDTPVLITGASGTGKELIAKAIHYNSSRRHYPLVIKNCAAFSEALLESELFGHTRGSFTGAFKDSKGLFRAAHLGTLFLDEIGEMSPALQAKLLRVLQDGTFAPVGSSEEEKVDVRVIAATHRNLTEMVAQGKFREDLYYRLSVLPLELPPLTERRDDVPLLIGHFLEKGEAKYGAPSRHLSEAAMDLLCRYSWPGNVRQLENEIERILILGNGQAGLLDINLVSPHIVHEVSKSSASTNGRQAKLKNAVEDVERRLILAALQESDWNKSKAAKILGISRSNLIAKVQQFGLEKSGDNA